MVWFKVPFEGSLAVLILASVLYLLGTLGTGLLISTVSRTQQEAFMTSFLVSAGEVLKSGGVAALVIGDVKEWGTPVQLAPRVWE